MGAGLRLRVVERGDVNAPPVLLLHGWACTAYSFAELFEPLAAAGHRVIAIEMPGHGLSDKPLDERVYTALAMCDAVEQAMQSLGLARTDIVAHSMGTAIALELARRMPSMVGRMVLIAPLGLDRIRVTAIAHVVSPGMMLRLMPAVVPRAVVKAVLHAVYGRRRPPTERDVDAYWAPSAFPDYGFAMIALLREFEWSAWPAARLAAIAAPTLLLCGQRDRLVRHNTVARSAQAMPNARLLVLPDVGHVPLAEAPEESVPPVIQFLASWTAGAKSPSQRW